MARAILIIGEPGTGKSRSIKGLNPAETVIIKPNSKELPFRGAGKAYIPGKNMFTLNQLPDVKFKNDKNETKTRIGIGSLLNQINKFPQIKNVIIEDLTHFFSERVVKERGTKGYDKWTELAADTKIHIIDKESSLRPDLNLFVIGHVSAVSDAAGNTSVGIQTPGKLLDNTIKIPSYFTYVFHTFVDQDDAGETRYRFLTNKDGIREAKTPEEMFPKYIDNDMQLIVDGIIEYQMSEGITPVGTKLPTPEEIATERAKQLEAEKLAKLQAEAENQDTSEHEDNTSPTEEVTDPPEEVQATEKVPTKTAKADK